MFDKFIIDENTVHNIVQDGETVGFSFGTRITYYRGLGVSMVEPFEVRIDGSEPVATESLRFTIGERTWTFAELENDFETRFEILDRGTVTVMIPGGLADGEHQLDVTEVLRVSYMPFPSRSRIVKTVQAA
jgi:hypothetical protein